MMAAVIWDFRSILPGGEFGFLPHKKILVWQISKMC